MTLQAPIVLVGTHRSGTTWLGGLVEQIPGVVYWPEPREVWSWGHWFRSDDVLTPEDATPMVARHIRRAFDRRVRREGGTRLCEKTPSNCLRVPFVRGVFPEARIILLLRDGRDVIRSTKRIQESGVSWSRVWQRLVNTSPLDYPALLSRIPWLMRKLLRRPLRVWGPRPKGWRDWLDLPEEVIAAKQWSSCIAAAFRDVQELDSGSALVVRYEELVTRPQEGMAEVLDFLGVPQSSSLVGNAQASADATRAFAWKRETAVDRWAHLESEIGPTLEMIGYEW